MEYGDLTIIIPTLNEAGNIGELLGIIKQSYGRAKIIVADDGSTDGTREIVCELLRVSPCGAQSVASSTGFSCCS